MSFIGVRLILACSLALARRARVRKQRHLAGVLDRRRDVPLVARAVARHPAGADLAAVRDVLAEQAGVLVVDVGRPVVAERADLLLRLANGWLGHRGALLRAPPAAGMLGCLYLWLVVRRAVRRSSRRGRRWPTGRTRRPRRRNRLGRADRRNGRPSPAGRRLSRAGRRSRRPRRSGRSG